MTPDERDNVILLFSHLMATGAAYFADNFDDFQGSSSPLSDHFTGMAESFVKYRPSFLDELRDALAEREVKS